MLKDKNILIILVLIFILIPINIFSDDFWSATEIAEIDGFSELDGVIKLSFKDSVDGKAIKGAKVTFLGEENYTDFSGVAEFDISLIEMIMDKDVSLLVEHDEYITIEDVLKVRVGTVMNKRFTMSKFMPANQARFVLEWDKKPRDLDAYLECEAFQISYRNKRNSENFATLDRDDTNSYGPETITLLSIDPDMEYSYSINNYSREVRLKNIKVTVYVNNELSKIIYIEEASQNKLDLVKIINSKVIY